MFKVAKVRSEIKKSSRVWWYKDSEFDYVMNGYWILQIDLGQEKYRKILSVLVEKFGAIPNVGEEISINVVRGISKIITLVARPDWMDFMEKQDLEKLEDTKLIHILFGKSCRILKGKDYVYINSKYFEMIDENLLRNEFKGNGPLKPIYLRSENDVIMILPVRMSEGNEYLKDITIEGNKKDSKGLQSQKSQ